MPVSSTILFSISMAGSCLIFSCERVCNHSVILMIRPHHTLFTLIIFCTIHPGSLATETESFTCRRIGHNSGPEVCEPQESVTIKAPTKKIQCLRGVLTGFLPVNQEDEVILQWLYLIQSWITQPLTVCKRGAQDVGQLVTDRSTPEGQTLLPARAAWPYLQRSQTCTARAGVMGRKGTRASTADQVPGPGGSSPCTPGGSSFWCHVHASVCESQKSV